jgi:N-acetylglucosaminyl-diphospho-decaprenol L-rhamnosyltransferase
VTARPDLTVTVVSWNTRDLLRRCLASLAAGARRASLEVMVVDNASADDSAGMVRREFPAVRLVENARNVGFAPACHQAWPLARGRYWMLLNPDAETEPAALDRLVAFLDAHPAAGGASARLVDADGQVQHSAQPRPSLALTALEASRLHKLLPRERRARTLLGPYWTYDRPVEVGWTWATALVVRREAVLRAGPPDPSFPMYGEDLEWCLRLAAHGFPLWHCADATVVHHGQGSANQRWDARARARRVEAACYRALERHRGAAWVSCLRSLRFAALLVEAVSAALRGRRLPEPLALALEDHWRTPEEHGSDDRHPHV